MLWTQQQDTTDQQQLVKLHAAEHQQKEACAIASAIPHFQPFHKYTCLKERQDGIKAAADTDVTVSFMLNFQF